MTETNQVALYKSFEVELAKKADEFANILPDHISPAKFMATAKIAVKNNPELLICDRRSLHQAIIEAAEDGLQPDGREGVIVVYNTKVKRGGKDVWTKEAQWQSMLYGLRKRAREIDGTIIDSQCVYDQDKFIWHQGDEPKIEHVPAPLNVARGNLVGAYAIFRKDGEILHREVMAWIEIEAVRNQSRGWQTSLMWTKFLSEAARKSVIRRAIKTVPSVPELERLVTRDDRNFAFAPAGDSKVIDITTRSSAGSIPPPVPASDDGPPAPDLQPSGDATPAVDEQPEEPKPKTAKADKATGSKAAPETREQLKERFRKALDAAETPTALNGVWDAFAKKWQPAEMGWANDAFDIRYNTLTDG